MSTASDRRAPGATRIPFDAMVEVGGALGPSYEAQAVNLSEDGMSLRTAYLPEVGQPITCRFDAGQGLAVIAAGEVLWKEDMGDGGEFGIRFTDLDGQSVEALHRILAHAAPDPLGRKVRLHIEGLASPMRARVKSAEGVCVTAYSELGFLQVGKPLELEDAVSGGRRPAVIDRVEVEVERESQIPHLVVTLRYDDEEAQLAMQAPPAPMHDEEMEREDVMMKHDETGRDAMPEGEMMDEGLHASTGAAEMAPAAAELGAEAEAEAKATPEDEESKKLKSAFARGAAKARENANVAFREWSKKAKTTIAMLAAKAKKKREEAAPIVRRTTAPPPGGALHAAGRKVVRGEIEDGKEFDPAPAGVPKFKITKKKIAIAGAVSAATLLAVLAVRKPAPAPSAANTTTTSADALPNAATAAATPAPTHATTAAIPMPAPTQLGANDPLAAQAAGMEPSGMTDTGSKHGKPQPFGNGPVGSHGNLLKIKMDGSIDRIQGASQPTGFTVMLPGRKSLESAAPLASKDNRIAAIKVENGPSGAELTVTFKDGVPNYQVRAKGDELEMALAKAPGATADKSAEAKPAHSAHKKHKKH